MSSEIEITTPRLQLRRFDADSHAHRDFIVELLNQRSFIDNIADRGVRTADDAARYLRDGPGASFARFGFGLMLIERREDGEALGMCGLLKRDYLDHPDIGYSLLDRHVGHGYVAEAAAATLRWGWEKFAMRTIVASTAPGNEDSVRVLERLGFRDEGIVQLPVHEGPSRYFVIDAPGA
jgi:ribosomal-protein-alanine N-acetyltransferase